MLAKYDFTGRHYVVAGGASGMGRSFAERLAESGATVYVADMNKQGVEELIAEQTAAGRKMHGFVMDACEIDQVLSTANQIIAMAGKIDGMIATIGIGSNPKPGESPVDNYNRLIAVNLQGMFNVCHAFAEEMIKTGGGSIVNLCSISATCVSRRDSDQRDCEYGLIGYCTSKGGVKLLTKSMAILFADYGIRVNCVSPGYVDTPMNVSARNNPSLLTEMASGVPLKRLADPSDIDGLVLFLLSEDSSYITGQDILIDGGLSSV